MIEDVKLSLRINNVAYDVEISDLIESARSDLILSGVTDTKANSDTDALIKRAILVYVKANFGWANVDAERLQQSYEAIRNHISSSLDYAYYAVTITALEQGEIIFDGVAKQTNISNVVIFYSKAKNHVAYQLIDKVISYIDVVGDTSIGA